LKCADRTERDFPYLDANSRAKIRQARNEKLAYNNGEGSNSNAEKENTRKACETHQPRKKLSLIEEVGNKAEKKPNLQDYCRAPIISLPLHFKYSDLPRYSAVEDVENFLFRFFDSFLINYKIKCNDHPFLRAEHGWKSFGLVHFSSLQQNANFF